MTLRSAFSLTAACIAAAALAWIALFRIVDSDFWWHLKAGQMVWQMKGLIAVDPFAYTREGLPYIANHEWLAQVLFAGIWKLGGSTGIILLRVFCTLAIGAVLLAVDRRNIWPNALLVIGAAVVLRQGLIERPQLLSNVLFAVDLLIGFRLLQAMTARHRKMLLSMLILFQILWVNLHGAAAVIAFFIIGGVFLQRLADAWADGMRRDDVRTLHTLAIGGILLFLAMFVAPTTYENFTYLWNLVTDRTAGLIMEWVPHSWPQYLLQLGPFWLIAIAALATTRKHWLAIGTMLLSTGILSRMASRHEALFVIAAVGCTFYELRWNAQWQSFLGRLTRGRWAIGAGVASLLILGGLWWINRPYQAFLARNTFLGFGAFASAEGAVDFMEQQKIDGKIFNTYSIGGYLLYRWAPAKKIFVDGRNIDYGYDFLSRALDARHDASIFGSLEREHGFTVAVLEHQLPAIGGKYDFGYLANDPTWALVYLDDWISVYAKRTPEHQTIIAKEEYKLLTPQRLDEKTVADGFTETQMTAVERELRRATEHDRRGIALLLELAALEGSRGDFPAATAHIDEAMRRSPDRYEPYQLAASVAAARGLWQDAAAFADRMLERTAYLPLELKYDAIAEIYDQAGEIGKAEKYRGMTN